MSIGSEEELRGMKAAGAIVARVLAAMKQHVRAGVTTRQLDEIGARVIRESGAVSAPRMVYHFPGDNCISVNDEAVHGIPGDRVIEPGDLVKLDVTIEKDGYMADAAVSVAVEPVRQLHHKLARCAERAFQRALLVARAGARVHDIGRAVENEVRHSGFSVVRGLCGHGIGHKIHEAPEVPNFYEPMARQELTEGLVITIEPIIAAGSGESHTAADGWTVKTTDGKPSAHYEHTIVITRGAPIILTA
ncbi:MAG: type I methionyl aminopeptidase [Acidobacteriia bacterium]|nr:type I methionyl aminopeptidase [Terriglobia bacterium]